jgi:hypothetical protein
VLLRKDVEYSTLVGGALYLNSNQARHEQYKIYSGVKKTFIKLRPVSDVLLPENE